MQHLKPRQALLLSLAAAIVTMAMKAGAWWVTGSVGYLSDALESLVNLSGATFALWMVTWARQPADHEHPYGHGKAEYLSAGFEGVLIFGAALAIVWVSVERLFNPQPIGALGLGTFLSIVASLVNFLVARVLFRVGRAYRSVALEADARHLMTDVWTTAGVVIGVALAVVTGWSWLDPAVALLVALNILREGWELVQRSVHGLMDHALDEPELARLNELLAPWQAQGVRFENLRTRVAGAYRFGNVDLQVPGHWSVERAHALADEVERSVADALELTLHTHLEPLPPGASGQAAGATANA